MDTGERRGEAPAFDENDLTSYRQLGQYEDPETNLSYLQAQA
jgi:hypothetical protein